MERILAFILGGVALALYGPFMFLSGTGVAKYQAWLIEKLDVWYDKVFDLGPGIFAGLALLLIAIRSKG